MADHTSADQTLTREELAAYLHGLAEEFERGAGRINVDVGNKTVSLSPPERVDCAVEVVERSTMIRGEHETIEIELNWKPESE
ncbi:amphi-Trp domain-containing protein [Natronobiforma cellulositropha]|uniref:amphi-Trp domain-containing protein n=1 Tax=Natronobiforma cellulositropha TaxID=1679076 RepID=UPI0021D5D5A5|nr:amphi-Trp domain-containing protein [Natronobiforma cellulositropha]